MIGAAVWQALEPSIGEAGAGPSVGQRSVVRGQRSEVSGSEASGPEVRGQRVRGQRVRGQWGRGQWVRGQWGRGQWARGQWGRGQWASGKSPAPPSKKTCPGESVTRRVDRPVRASCARLTCPPSPAAKATGYRCKAPLGLPPPRPSPARSFSIARGGGSHPRATFRSQSLAPPSKKRVQASL